MAGAVLLAAMGTTGCTGGADVGATPTGRTSAPIPPSTPPAATSGPLDSAALPAPEALGEGWAYWVEGSDPEEGLGNDTPFQERDAAEIVDVSVPMGCEQRSGSPTPRHVLQATYRHGRSGGFAVALRMRFDSDDEARAFAQARSADLATCRDQPDDPYSGAPAPVLAVTGTAGRLLAEYELVGEPGTWTSLQVVDGTDVLTVDAGPDGPDLVDWSVLGGQPVG